MTKNLIRLKQMKMKMKRVFNEEDSKDDDDYISHIQPIRRVPVVNKHIPFIVNMVGTVCILPQDKKRYRLPLEAIAMQLGPCSQYAPLQFAANIFKITNSTTDSTILAFASGKLVLVSALSEWHMRYISQLFRLIVENVPCMLMDEETKTVSVGSLKGRTVFDHCVSHNVVGHGDFGFKVNLMALKNANPEAVDYIEDSFPAAKTNVWLTSDQECHCATKRLKTGGDDDGDDEVNATLFKAKVTKNGKCPCTIKCLIFKSGKIVLIGARRVQDINAVFARIMTLVSGFKDGHDAFYQSLGQVLVPKQQQQQQKKPKIHGERELSETEAIALAVADARSFKNKSIVTVKNETLTPLMRLADQGRLDQVKMTLEMDPNQLNMKDAQGMTAFDRLVSTSNRSFEQELVLDFLQKQEGQK